jgi:tRNA dimethylallyltransferase
MPNKPKLVVITGETGSGKSSLAIEIAGELRAEIVNADSLAFYRGMDIGTAKPSISERKGVAHHLFDLVDPDQDFTVADYVKLARPLIFSLLQKGSLPLVVGGTGLYIRSLTQGLFEGPGADMEFRNSLRKKENEGASLYALLADKDPLSVKNIKPTDRVRIERALEVLHLTGESIAVHQRRHALADQPFDVLTVILHRDVDERNERIKLRTERMFEQGLVHETKSLLEQGYSPNLKPLRSVGYLECVKFLNKEMTLPEAMERTVIRTRQLAKRQRTWFKGQFKQGRWMYPYFPEALRVIEDFLQAP